MRDESKNSVALYIKDDNNTSEVSINDFYQPNKKRIEIR